MWYLPPVMMEEARFCPRCSARLEMREVNGAQRPRCPECGRVIYYDPKLAATVVVERDERVLMVRRAIQPGIGLWSLPGGYVDRGEVVEKAAAREVLEETGSAGEHHRPAGHLLRGGPSRGACGLQCPGGRRRGQGRAGGLGVGVLPPGRAASPGISQRPNHPGGVEEFQVGLRAGLVKENRECSLPKLALPRP